MGLIAVDLLREVTSGPGVVVGGDELGVLLQQDLRSAAEAQLLAEQQGLDQLTAYLLAKDFAHMLSRAGVVEHAGDVGLLAQEVPQGPVVDAGGIAEITRGVHLAKVVEEGALRFTYHLTTAARRKA